MAAGMKVKRSLESERCLLELWQGELKKNIIVAFEAATENAREDQD